MDKVTDHSTSSGASSTGVHRVALVSCVKKKQLSAAAASDLYISPLFKLMRRYAEVRANAWFILSAEHGVLSPDQVVAPYERTLKFMSKHERVMWAGRVQAQLRTVLPRHATVIFLAGLYYRDGVMPFLVNQGYAVEIPMVGLKLGAQLQWLNKQLQHE